MYSFIKFCTLAFVVFGGAFSQKQCNDCMNYDRCPEALNLALNKKNDETLQRFNEAFCGFDNSGSIPVAKICCSAFPTPAKEEPIQETAEDNRIANHRNLHLLPDDCGVIKGDRIYGGKIADLYEFPWMALISHQTRYGINFKCGGTIINKRYILTAAHCVKNKLVAGVRVGEYNLNTEIDCVKDVCEPHKQDIPVETAIVHENYGMTKGVNDIALLRLAEDIDFSHANVQRVCLPTTAQLRQRALTNELATVTGWGLTENHTDSSVLRKVIIPIFSAQQCSEVYNRFSRPGEDATINQFCAGAENKDSCNGDSGGPLMLEGKYNNINRYVQYGLVSHGPIQCGSGSPGAYTDIRKYMGWILDHMS